MLNSVNDYPQNISKLGLRYNLLTLGTVHKRHPQLGGGRGRGMCDRM